MTLLLGLVTPLIAHTVVTLLHVIVPSRRRAGYVRSELTGQILTCLLYTSDAADE